MNIKKELLKTARNSIRLSIGGAADEKVGASRFGGRPDVPEGFERLYFEGGTPLCFVAQFDLRALAPFDTEKLLPETGLLSFFLKPDATPRSCDPDENGGAVFYFEDISVLHTAEGNAEVFRIPALNIAEKSEISYQSYEDFLLQREKFVENWEDFEAAQRSIGIKERSEISKLLGWTDPLGENMTRACELLSRGYYLGDEESRAEVTPLDRQEAEQWSARDWLPLLQLDTESGGLETILGGSGRLYFYIRRDDLAAKKFNDVRIIMQSR